MGKALGKTTEEITALTTCALLHDNALTEYIFIERTSGQHDPAMKNHCEFGQRNVDDLHFNTNVKNFIMYHHERADGKGPFGIREGEGPLEAELIAIADSIDVANHLQQVEPERLASLCNSIAEESGKRYGKIASQAMLEILDEPTLLSLKDNAIHESFAESFLPWTVDIGADVIFGLASFMSKVIDYKSVFTQRHSTQIANRALFMGDFYKYSPVQRTEFYLAAALHDLGKLQTPTEILEKPGKLTSEEFSIIKEHARGTWELLKDIDGFQLISVWAASHHEKLNGSGYPFGKKAEELDFNSRLMACIDIYQAVSEDRPYHPGRDHESTMQILYKMASNGEIDENIVKNVDTAFAKY
jgi:HD-GYP domain-containing protein (c-di-GMP phosphodiesterase class II)